jgi:Tfp pilus assembly protein FimT
MKGFTFIEMILMVALVLFIGTMAIPFYMRFAYSEDLSIVRDEIVQSLKQARLATLLGKNDGRWGVAVRPEEVIFFQGDTYETRNSRYDQSYPLSAQVRVSGADEVVFDRPGGTLDDPVTMVLSDGDMTETLTINREGIVE